MAQLWLDWDSQFRHKKERDIREEIRKLDNEESEICIIKFNLRKKNLNSKLEEINNQRKESNELRIKEKY